MSHSRGHGSCLPLDRLAPRRRRARTRRRSSGLGRGLFGLFREMNTPGTTAGGRFEGTPYFNGGLFATVTPFNLAQEEVVALGLASQENWAAVRPAIFGTLFEQSLDKPERHAYGAYFTSEADIQKVVLPCIVRPWRKRIEDAGSLPELGQIEGDVLALRVLDPACGSGNFLYVAYRELRRLEHQLDETLAA
jgi:type II restriction/modification system DNA methylase subunit YeeA